MHFCGSAEAFRRLKKGTGCESRTVAAAVCVFILMSVDESQSLVKSGKAGCQKIFRHMSQKTYRNGFTDCNE